MGAHFERARVLFRQRRYAHAEQEIREELALYPHSGWAHAFLGRCLAQQKHLPEALKEGEEGVRLAPQLPHAHYLLGLTYLDCGRLKEAEAALHEALRLDPQNATYLEWLSWVQFQRGDRVSALATVDQALAIDPEHVGCLNYRGQYKRVLGNWSDAQETLRESLRVDPENDFAHANLAWALYFEAIARDRAGGKWGSWPWRPEMDEAFRHSLEALRLNPCSEFAKTTAAEILMAPWRVILVSVGLAAGAVAICLTVGLIASAPPPAGAGSDLSPQGEGFVKGAMLSLWGVLTLGFSNGPLYMFLRRSHLGDAVLSPARRRAANATILCLIVAVVAAVAAVLTPPPTAFAAVFLSLALVQPLTVACEATLGWPRNLMISYCALLTGVGLTCLASIYSGDHGTLSPAVATLAVWVTAASVLSRSFGRFLQKQFVRKAG